MSDAEKLSIQEQLEEIQKRDWKTLSIDEKKAGAFLVSFGLGVGLLIVWRAFYFFAFIFGSVLRGVWAAWSSCSD